MQGNDIEWILIFLGFELPYDGWVFISHLPLIIFHGRKGYLMGVFCTSPWVCIFNLVYDMDSCAFYANKRAHRVFVSGSTQFLAARPIYN